MFIRKVKTCIGGKGDAYFSYRLVESRRVGKQVKQIVLLNLGRHFSLPEARWKEACQRIEALLAGQQSIFDVCESVERVAQSCYRRLLDEQVVSLATEGDKATADVCVEVIPDSLELVQPRSIGVEHVALAAMKELEFEPLLAEQGINGVMRTTIISSIIARMAAPDSELGTHRWLTGTSGLGELLDVDLPSLSLSRLYRASDLLMTHREAIEAGLFSRIENLFSLPASVTLYDLTNTYFEGTAKGHSKSANGRSKEKRSDCPLVTLALVCDGSGFLRRSRVFAGNAVEWRTLKEMLTDLGASKQSTVIMDRGIATEANVKWLREEGYRYLVVSRERNRYFDEEKAESLTTAHGDTIRLVREEIEGQQEVRLHCYSEGRAQKEQAISTRFCEKFEAGLAALAKGLTTPKGAKQAHVIQERIGRLKASCHGVGQHYKITIQTSGSDPGDTAPLVTEGTVPATPASADNEVMVTALTWEKTPKTGTMLTDPGVYCLRSNETDWDASRLWQTYMMLTDQESVIRSLKSELGMRPIYHSNENRIDGHLFIAVLAYQFVQTIRRHLKEKGIHFSWSTLRDTLSVQRRVTATFSQKDGRTLHIRKATHPEVDIVKIYDALGLNHYPGGTKKMIF